MARTDLVVTVHLSKEFKGFIDLFADTLNLVTDAVHLIESDNKLLMSDAGQIFMERMSNIVARSEQVDYGKS